MLSLIFQKGKENTMSTELIKPKLKEEFKIKKPKNYKVIFFNDDFTPFFFVEQLLNVIFNKTHEEAIFIANKVHSEGSHVVGIYPLEIAQTKQAQTMFNAKQNGFPLLCEIEEDSE